MANSTLTVGTRALLRRDASGRLQVRRYLLKVRGRGGRPVVVGGRLVVGSGAEADVRVSDPTVSRRHVELLPSPTSVAVRDLGSKNGTFVAGVRVGEVSVERSAVLELGRCVVELEVEDAGLDEPDAQRGFGGLVGDSPAMRQLYGQLGLLALADSSVLLTGETGTGKGHIARSLHEHSLRRGGPFEAVDCGALSAELVESALFGHVKGAFTGAVQAHRGAFSRAHGGTLFLDGVGDLDAQVQPKLLRALEARTIQPVGAESAEPVDVRVIAATSRDLRGPGFRADLFYRLAVLEVAVPPLRARDGDVLLLARHFAAELGQASLPEAWEGQLARHSWPGNVRELRNCVERAVVLGELEPLEAVGHGDGERARVEQALAACAWNQSAAARLLGISRGTLISRIERYRLPRPRARS